MVLGTGTDLWYITYLPPLFAELAAGWVFLNVLSFLVAKYMVFRSGLLFDVCLVSSTQDSLVRLVGF